MRKDKNKFEVLILILICLVGVGIGFMLNSAINNNLARYNDLLLNIDTLQAQMDILESNVEKLHQNSNSDTQTTQFKTQGNVAGKSVDKSKNETVWKTKTGEKYHRKDCESLDENAIQISIQEAISAGIEPCKRCFE